MTEGASGRDAAWLAGIYGDHGGEILGFCARLLGDRGLAEEVTQDVFTKAWRARADFDATRASTRTWLFRIARNSAIDAHRARSVRPAVTEVGDRGEVGAPDSDIDGLAERWLVEWALSQLPDAQRTAVVEVHLRGRPYRDVADELDVPVGTVKSRVFHGLAALRDLLEGL